MKTMSDAKITRAWVKGVSANGEHMSVNIGWVTKEHGFGVITFVTAGPRLIIHTETLSKDFVKRVLDKFIDDAEVA
jgi:hypothetical protein